MSAPEQFRLRWRGQTSAPYPLAQIEQMLDEREIGLWHEIELDGQWLTLEDFLARRRQLEKQIPAVRLLDAQPHLASPRLPEAPPVSPSVSPPPDLTSPADGQFTFQPPLSAPRRPLYRPKSLKLFVALGLVFGFVGGHNFYAGYRGTAVAQLLLTAVTLWLGFGFFVSWMWAFIELLIVQTDHKGVRMV
jgi:TM2 domain-containing membrane protein YozV